MSFFSGFKEKADTNETNGGKAPEISEYAQDKFDKLMGDDKLQDAEPRSTGLFKEDAGRSSDEKFDNLFKASSVTNDAERSAGASEECQGETDSPHEPNPKNEVDGDVHEANGAADASPEVAETKSEGLTEEEKARIKEETGWSNEIIDHIKSMEQYEIYKNAGLHEGEVNRRKCLLKDIDLDYIDPKTISDKHPEGMTNRELMQKGRSPYDSKTGEKIELHHMGQDFDSPFAELAENSEHGDGNDTILHDKSTESWRQDPEKNKQYSNVQRPDHWKARAQEG